MNQDSAKTAQPDLDTQVLSDFIYDLNIARRQLALYPAEHPQVISSSNTVLKILRKLCEFRNEITLGVAPETLVFEQNWLDHSNPVYRDFARFLSSLDIASISFFSDLTAAELIQFNQILRNDSSRDSAGHLPALLEQHDIQHISVMPVDYSVFQAGNNANQGHDPADNLLWDDFLQGLLTDRLDKEGKSVSPGDRVSPELVAEMLNQATQGKTAKEIDYDQVISSFIARMQADEKRQAHDLAQQFGTLARDLNPELKRSFLNSTFRALERHPGTSNLILQTLPQDIIADALREQSNENLSVSSRLVDLLGQFSTQEPGADRHAVRVPAEELSAEMLQARVEILLLEDNHDAYVPGDYQKTLQSILSGKVRGSIPDQTAGRLKYNLEKQSVERQCCAVIFNMLRNRVDSDIEAIIQNNLVEISHFFLETGDFLSLREIFVRWSDYLYSDQANARFLDEKVLASQTREVFMNEVLDNMELWGKDKYDEICDYVAEVGAPYAELLVDRLGHEEQMARRKIWMRLLTELGNKGHQIIIQALQDNRWYLVRNLLIVLGRQREALPMKAVHQLSTHPHPKVRQEALRILFRCNPATANRLLLKELSSGNRQSLAATIQLAELSQDGQVLNQLHQILQTEQLEEEDFAIKCRLLETLAFLGRPESIPVLAKLLKKKGLIRTRRQKLFQQEIIKTLGAYPRHAAEPLINSLIQGRDREHSRLARTLIFNQAETNR